jgi:hypothetical protein
LAQTEFVAFFSTAYIMGLAGPDSNVNFIGPDGLYTSSFLILNTTEAIQAAYGAAGLLCTFPRQPNGPIYDTFNQQWQSLDPDTNPGAGPGKNLTSFQPYTIDAVYSVAWAIDKLIREGGEPGQDGPRLLTLLRNETVFEGLTGTVSFDVNGDRNAVYSLFNFILMPILNESFWVEIGIADGIDVNITSNAVFSDSTTTVPDAAYRVVVNYDDPIAITMVILCSLGILLILLFTSIILYHWNTPIILSTSPRFIFGISLGLLCGFCNVFVWTGEPTDALCQARPWILLTGIALTLGNLYAKSCRIYYLIDHGTKALSLDPIRDSTLFFYVILYISLFCIPLIVWTVAFPLEARRMDNNPDNNKVNIMCNGKFAEDFLIYFLVLSLISIVFGVLLSFLMRNIHDFFSEMSYIGYTLYTICITGTVVLPMLFILSGDPSGFYIVFILGCFFANSSALLFLFLPKVYVILFRPKKNTIPLDDEGCVRTTRMSRSIVGQRKTAPTLPATTMSFSDSSFTQ